MENFGLFNVVWYDGSSAYVSKFILPSSHGEISNGTLNRLEKYLEGNGDILKTDYLYPLSFDNIKAMETSIDNELKTSVDRFAQMYFITD